MPPRSLPPGLPRRAFTLIELLTVIAIIGILSAILIPTVGRVREAARTSQCSSNMRQIVMALQLYAQENRGFYPAASGRDANNNPLLWTKEVRPYLPLQGTTSTSKENAVFVCPSANYNGFTGSALNNTYAVTAAMLGPSGGVLGRLSTAPRLAASVDSARLSRIPFLVEGKASSSNPNSSTQSNFSWSNARGDLAGSGPDAATFLDLRHASKMNVAYADGSVRIADFATLQAFTQPLWEGVP